jgi:hypothetical protein
VNSSTSGSPRRSRSAAGTSSSSACDKAPVDDRIRQVVANAGIADDFFVDFSGNVELLETTYSPGESALTAIQEAADAEFPTVANFYPDRFGRGVFHGRLAKFDPKAQPVPDLVGRARARLDVAEQPHGPAAQFRERPREPRASAAGGRARRG